MKTGPDYRRPDTGIAIPDAYQHAPSKKHISIPDDPWWEVFNNTELNQIVEAVLRNNLDIKKATAVILEVRALFARAGAGRFPEIGIQGQAQRKRQTINTVFPGPQGQIYRQSRKTTDSHILSMPASFELDLWGRLARGEEAARADLLQAEENRRTIAQTVVAETISLYMQAVSLERRIKINKERIEISGRILALTEYRYRHGLSTALNVKNERQALDREKSDLPALTLNLGITMQKLTVLLGYYPDAQPLGSSRKDYINNIAPVPSGLPSGLLLQRPDIRAAEAKLKALNARIGEAMANRFPRITLTGNFGYSNEALHMLLHSKSALWNMALGLVQPVFDAGKLKSGQRAAEARYQKGVTDYAGIVLNAFFEVESTLLTRREQMDRRNRLIKILSEAQSIQKNKMIRYERGLKDYMEVLKARQATILAEESLEMINLSILQNRIALHRVMGGGWGEPLSQPEDEEAGFFDFMPFFPNYNK